MKRIITCSDGTWDNPKHKDEGVLSPSNVFRFKKLIAFKGDDNIVQIPFYDAGVGTNWYDHISGGAFGIGINQNIIDAYLHIVYHYEPGDEIYLIGFSRGAYTARSVAGFIRNCGLLKRENEDLIEEAFKLYKRRDDNSHPNAKEALVFRERYSHPDVRIKFIGVWDTVGSLGIPIKCFQQFNKEILDCQFHDTELSSYVDYAYHALAIDEHRKPFLPTLWHQKESARLAGQIMEQVWFSGVHCDVGGGYNERGLSDCTLLWMIEKASLVGLQFNDISNIFPDSLDEMHNSMTLFYRIFGYKNREVNKGDGYNEYASPSVNNRLTKNIGNYKNKVNPNIINLLKTISPIQRNFFFQILRRFQS